MSELQNEKAPSNGALQGAAQPTASQPVWRTTPELDLYESPAELLVLLNVPGASPESINVQVLGNELHVRAERAEAARATDVARVVFERHFALPVEVDGNSATAELRDGVLEVRLQKSASARRVKIPVSAN